MQVLLAPGLLLVLQRGVADLAVRVLHHADAAVAVHRVGAVHAHDQRSLQGKPAGVARLSSGTRWDTRAHSPLLGVAWRPRSNAHYRALQWLRRTCTTTPLARKRKIHSRIAGNRHA